MAIEAGQHLLNFRLIEKIGEGGMGVVWKAVDTTLDREVAIKVLPELLSGEADRVARLEREAKLLGALNHPNVATVHGLHVDRDNDGTRFLVMELVDGEDLSVRLARGPLPPEAAVEIARQIAEGLEAAHAAGVVHRDLKPANVKLTGDGRVKVLDFGLARAFECDPTSRSGEISPTMSPTLTSAGTLAGKILGTAAYMSPEQARGHAVDAQTDVWAFGVVLYEMLTGRAAFKGDSVSDTLAAVLKVDPDLEALPAGVPPRVRRLVTRCLHKDRKHRLHHIADARIMLEDTQAGVAEEPSGAAARGSTGERALWATAVILIGVASAAITWELRSSPAPAAYRKILLALDGEDPDDPTLKDQKISPDGARLAYRNGKLVFVRDLDDWASREIVAAEGAGGLFWSPDGAALGFSRDNALWRVSPDGGAAAKICDLPESLSDPSWGSDGDIVLVGTVDHGTGLWAVPDRGGEPRKLLLAEKGTHFHGVHALPEGRGVLTALHARPEMQIGVVAGGAFRKLFALETTYLPGATFSPTGHVLYRRGGTNAGLWARPISLKTLELTGEPFLVAAGASGFSVSRDGNLVYRPSSDTSRRRLVWVDRAGQILETIGAVQEGLTRPSLSPDGGRLAVQAGADDHIDIWVVDLARSTQTRLTFEDGQDRYPTWTPDGKRVLYLHEAGEEFFVMITDADGSGEPETLAKSGEFSLSPDGRHLITTHWSDDEKNNIWMHDLEREDDEALIVGTAADERHGRVSPDGAYIAYVSDESGRDEIYLKRFPSGTGKWQVSVDGGSLPLWHPRGGELFWEDDGTMMRVDVETRGSLKLGTPSALFAWEPYWTLHNWRFDVAADAQRFVLVVPEGRPEAVPNQVRLVENWLAGL